MVTGTDRTKDPQDPPFEKETWCHMNIVSPHDITWTSSLTVSFKYLYRIVSHFEKQSSYVRSGGIACLRRDTRAHIRTSKTCTVLASSDKDAWTIKRHDEGWSINGVIISDDMEGEGLRAHLARTEYLGEVFRDDASEENVGIRDRQVSIFAVADRSGVRPRTLRSKKMDVCRN